MAEDDSSPSPRDPTGSPCTLTPSGLAGHLCTRGHSEISSHPRCHRHESLGSLKWARGWTKYYSGSRDHEACRFPLSVWNSGDSGHLPGPLGSEHGERPPDQPSPGQDAISRACDPHRTARRRVGPTGDLEQDEDGGLGTPTRATRPSHPPPSLVPQEPRWQDGVAFPESPPSCHLCTRTCTQAAILLDHTRICCSGWDGP